MKYGIKSVCVCVCVGGGGVYKHTIAPPPQSKRWVAQVPLALHQLPTPVYVCMYVCIYMYILRKM